MASRSRSVDGNETWLTRPFAAAMARRSKEAIRRASASTKPSSSESRSARLTYPYRSAVSPSKSFAPRIISSARPRPTRCGRRSVPPPPGCTPTPTSGCPSRVFSRDAKRMSQARTNSLLPPRTQPRIFAILTTGDFVRRTNVSIRIGRPEGPTAVVMFLAGQIKVGEIEIGNRALEHDDAQPLTGVHPKKQILEASKGRRVQNVERRIIEHDPPVGRRFLDDPDGRC